MLEPLSTVHGLSFGWHVACRDFRKDHQTKAHCWELGQLGDGGVMLPLSFCGLGGDGGLHHCIQASGHKPGSMDVFKCVTLTKMGGHSHQYFTVDLHDKAQLNDNLCIINTRASSAFSHNYLWV